VQYVYESGEVMQKRVLQAIGWLSAVTVLRFLPFFLLNQTLFFGDLFTLFVPGKLYSAEWLMNGETPYWNPHVFGGISWWGDISQSVTYPSTWLFGWLAPAQALMVTVVSHWWLLLIGAYLVAWRLSRRHYPSLIAAVFFAASPPVTSLLHNLAMLQTVAWLPWITLAALKQPKQGNVAEWWRWLVFTSALVAVQWYAGYPTLALMSLGVATVSMIIANEGTSLQKIKHDLWWILACGLGTMWALPALWPFVQTVLDSTRLSGDSMLSGSIHPAELIKTIFPFLFEMPWWRVRWGPVWTHPPTPIMYLGTAVVSLLGAWWLKGKEKFVFGVWIAMAGMAVVVSLLGERVGLGLVRVPVVWHLLAQWCIVLAGLGTLPVWEAWWDKSKGSLEKWLARGIVVSIVIVLGSLAVGIVAYLWPQQWWQFLNGMSMGRLAMSVFHNPARDSLITLTALGSLGVLVVSAAGSMLAWRLRSARGLFLVLTAEFLITTQVSLFFMPADVLNSEKVPERVAQTIKLSKQQGWRVLTRSSNAPYADLPAYWEALQVRAPFSDSFIDAFEVKNGKHLTTLKQGLAPNWLQLEGVSTMKGYGAFIPNTFEQLKAADGTSPINSLPQLGLKDPLLSSWGTKYYIVDGWYPIPLNELNELVTLNKPYDDGRWQIFELEAEPRVRAPQATYFNLNSFELTANTETAVISYSANQDVPLFFADRFEPGWSATIDGVSVPTPHHEGMRVVILPPTPVGQAAIKAIKWQYMPPALDQAQKLVLLSVILVMGVSGMLSVHTKPTKN
jgi:hypothetical protein